MHYLNLFSVFSPLSTFDLKLYLILMTNNCEFDLTLHLLTNFSTVAYKMFLFFGLNAKRFCDTL